MFRISEHRQRVDQPSLSNERIVGDEPANAFLARPYRKGYEIRLKAKAKRRTPNAKRQTPNAER